MRRSFVWIPLLSVAAGLGWFWWMASLRTVGVAGDPLGAYYPTVEALRSQPGLLAFAPLWQGLLRMPGYPVLLTIGSFFTPDFIRAGQIIGIASAALVLWLVARATLRLGAGSVLTLAVSLATATNPLFVKSALESLPDMPCCAAILASVLLLIAPDREEPRPWVAFSAGLLGACATLLRINALGLLVGGAAAILLNRDNTDRRNRAKMFTAGLFIGLLPLAAPAIALQLAGIDYPSAYVYNVDIGVEGPLKSSSWMAVQAILRGILELPRNIDSTVRWPISLAAFGFLVAASFLPRHQAPRVVLVVLIGLVGFLIPVHFEARYYLWLVPISFASVALAIAHAPLRRARRPALFAVVSGALLFSHAEATSAIADAEHAVRVMQPYETICERIVERTQVPGEPMIVGVALGTYWWSYFRDCPRPRLGPPVFQLVDAKPNDVGLTAWIARDGDPSPTSAELVESSGGFRIFRRLDRGIIPASSADGARGDELLDEAWLVEFPRRPTRKCLQREIDVPPGRYEVYAELSSTPPLVGRLQLRVAEQQKNLWAVGEKNGAVLKTEIGMPRHARLSLSLCAQDPLRAVGNVTLHSLRLRPIYRHPESEPFCPSSSSDRAIPFPIHRLPYEERPNLSGTTSTTTFWPEDEAGVRILVVDGIRQYHPMQLAGAMLAFVDSYWITNNPFFIQRAELYAEKLLSLAKEANGSLYFPYQFDFALHGDPLSLMRAPWYSGLAQGTVLSAFSRLYCQSGNPRYLEMAEKIWRSLTPRRDHSAPDEPWVTDFDSAGNYRIQEYPGGNCEFVLSGHNAATLGLYDYHVAKGDEESRALLAAALTTVLHSMEDFRVVGDTSMYCLGHPDRKPGDTPRIYAEQFDTFFGITGEFAFKRMAEALRLDAGDADHADHADLP